MRASRIRLRLAAVLVPLLLVATGGVAFALTDDDDHYVECDTPAACDNLLEDEVRNRWAGLCLATDPARRGDDHAPVVLSKCDYHYRYKRWNARSVGHGHFELRASLDQRCLDVAKSSIDDRAPRVQLYRCHGGSNQQWRLIRSGHDVYVVSVYATEDVCDRDTWMVLDAAAGSGSPREDNKVQLYPYNSGSNQRWFGRELFSQSGPCTAGTQPEPSPTTPPAQGPNPPGRR